MSWLKDQFASWIPDSIKAIFDKRQSANNMRLQDLNSAIWDQMLEQEAALDSSRHGTLVLRYRSFYPTAFDTSPERIYKFEQLLELFDNPDRKRLWPLTYGAQVEFIVSGLTASFITIQYRRATGLALAQAGNARTSLPSIAIPLSIHPFVTHHFVYRPLVEGSVTCAPCLVARAALISGVMGVLHPLFLASLTCFYYADIYKTMALPRKWLYNRDSLRTVRGIWWKKTSRMGTRLVLLGLVNMIFGGALATLQMFYYYKVYDSLNRAIERNTKLKLID